MVAQSSLCVPATSCWSLLSRLQVCLCLRVCQFCCIGGTWPWSPLLLSTHLLMIPYLPLMTSLEPLHKEAVRFPLLDCCMVTAAQLLAFMLPLTCEEGIKLFFPVLRFHLKDSLSLSDWAVFCSGVNVWMGNGLIVNKCTFLWLWALCLSPTCTWTLTQWLDYESVIFRHKRHSAEFHWSMALCINKAASTYVNASLKIYYLHNSVFMCGFGVCFSIFWLTVQRCLLISTSLELLERGMVWCMHCSNEADAVCNNSAWLRLCST